MVQGVFLELGSCFLAKMACISPTNSHVKHRTLNFILTFFSALSTRPSTEEILIYGNLVLSYVCCQAIFYSHWSSVGETGLGIGFQTFDLFHLMSHQVFNFL